MIRVTTCFLLACASLLHSGCAQDSGAVAPQVPKWNGETVRDLHREYYNIFKYGNRNAASHLWSTFLLDRAPQFSASKLEYFFTGYCAVSGSPVNPSDYNRYRLTLPMVGGGHRTGYMHYCCWPCVCDTQDFIRVDTKTIILADGETREYHFAVLGNPCEHAEELAKPFVQPFGRGTTTLRESAPEVRCGANNELLGATLSDNGYPIIAMFFDSDLSGKEGSGEGADSVAMAESFTANPGRLTTASDGVQFNDEAEFGPMCTDRANNGFNSGMGEIFRKVAEIRPVRISACLPSTSTSPHGDSQEAAVINVVGNDCPKGKARSEGEGSAEDSYEEPGI